MQNLLVEPGSAVEQLVENRPPQRKKAGADPERFDVVIIGGGQAGLAVGYQLARHGLRFVILDAEQRIGDSWRKRWQSLRLFTPARYDGLEGMTFPGPPNAFPTKDEMADYLEAYAAKFRLPVRSGARVDRLSRSENGGYWVQVGATLLEAPQVVIAIGNYQRKRVPDFAWQVAPTTVQFHSSDYRNPSQLQDGDVLLVGAGNSGAEIAAELAKAEASRAASGGGATRRRRIWISGSDVGQVPFRIDGLWARLLLARIVFRLVFHRILTIRTPMGRSARPKMLHKAAPLIRTKTKQLSAAGITRVARVVGVRDGKPVLADDRALDVANVIWCTGFHPGFSWIDLPVFDRQGDPKHVGGIVADEPGLYFVGLHFLFSMSSGMIQGVSRDAARIVDTLASRAATSVATPVEHAM